MADLISASAVEIAAFFSPVRLAVEDELELTHFLRRFGYALPDGRVNAIVGNLAPLRDGIIALFEAAESATEGEVDADAILDLIAAARPLFSSLRSLDSQLSSLAGSLPSGPLIQPFSEALAAFPEELFDLLLADYLTGRAAVLLHVLILAGVYQVEEIPAEGHARSRGLSYARTTRSTGRAGVNCSSIPPSGRATCTGGASTSTATGSSAGSRVCSRTSAEQCTSTRCRRLRWTCSCRIGRARRCRR